MVSIASSSGGGWRIEWNGNSGGASHFAFRMIALDGGGLSTLGISPAWGTYRQPSAQELDFDVTWTGSEANVSGVLTFSSTSAAVAFKVSSDSPFNTTTIAYLAPGNVLKFPTTDEFALDIEPIAATIPNPFDNVFCTTFE